MVINISEAQFNKLFHTRQDSFLNENRESKNMKMARNVVREMKPSTDPQEVITAIRNDIPNTRMLDCKFLQVLRVCVLMEKLSNVHRYSSSTKPWSCLQRLMVTNTTKT